MKDEPIHSDYDLSCAHESSRHINPIEKARIVSVIVNLYNACESLMNEVCQKKATDWGIVNDAMVGAERLLSFFGISTKVTKGKYNDNQKS